MSDAAAGDSQRPDLRARLDLALRAALRARDQPAIAAVRSALAAIANAEAAEVGALAVAGQYDDAGHGERAARLRAEAAALQAVLDQDAGGPDAGDQDAGDQAG
jgi:uncharacterized protein YqeY